MTFKGLAKLVEEIGELTQVAGKKMAYTDGNHPDGKGDLNSRMQEEMGDVVAAIAFVSKKLSLDAIAIDAIAECELTTVVLNGLPQMVRNLGRLICAIYGRGQKPDENGILEYQMGLSLASMNFVVKSLNLDQKAIATRAARKVWQYEAWDRQKP